MAFTWGRKALAFIAGATLLMAGLGGAARAATTISTPPVPPTPLDGFFCLIGSCLNPGVSVTVGGPATCTTFCDSPGVLAAVGGDVTCTVPGGSAHDSARGCGDVIAAGGNATCTGGGGCGEVIAVGGNASCTEFVGCGGPIAMLGNATCSGGDLTCTVPVAAGGNASCSSSGPGGFASCGGPVAVGGNASCSSAGAGSTTQCGAGDVRTGPIAIGGDASCTATNGATTTCPIGPIATGNVTCSPGSCSALGPPGTSNGGLILPTTPGIAISGHATCSKPASLSSPTDLPNADCVSVHDLLGAP